MEFALKMHNGTIIKWPSQYLVKLNLICDCSIRMNHFHCVVMHKNWDKIIITQEENIVGKLQIYVYIYIYIYIIICNSHFVLIVAYNSTASIATAFILQISYTYNEKESFDLTSIKLIATC